ncbi:MAG: fused MFS/spermidine synthase [Pyrinomonadaceae bacterium]
MSLYRRFFIETTVFCCGAVVMIYEIVGSRILAPFVGTSTYTWTSLIGVILAALSLGYWLGGKRADRGPTNVGLAAVVFGAAILITITILIQEFVLTFLAALRLPLEISATIAALLLFAPAAVMLGVVSPYAVRLSAMNLETTGQTVGRLYALSTVGSIGGTFLAGFVMLPFVGSIRTLYVLAAVLFAISLASLPTLAEKTKAGALTLLVISVVFVEGRAILLRNIAGLVDIDTGYNRLRVFDTTKNGRPIRALSTDPLTWQTSMYLDDYSAGSTYSKFFHLARGFRPGFQKVLLIGGAGYSVPKEFRQRYPNAELDVVEIDPGMTEVAKKYFRLTADAKIRIAHQDGRIYLNNARADTYDLVILDAFNSLFSVPFHLTTIESAKNARRVLKPNGLLLVNIGSAVDGEGGKMFRAEAATLSEVFKNLRVFFVDKSKPRTSTQNIIIAASESGLGRFAGDAETDILLKNEIAIPSNLEPVLTDDLAPVERYANLAARHFE